MPTIKSKAGASRCHPIPAPTGYSVMRTSANSAGLHLVKSAIRSRSGKRNSGNRRRRANPCALIFITPSEVRCPSLGNDTVHLDLSKLKIANRGHELSFFISRDELGRIDQAIGKGPFIPEEFELSHPTIYPLLLPFSKTQGKQTVDFGATVDDEKLAHLVLTWPHHGFYCDRVPAVVGVLQRPCPHVRRRLQRPKAKRDFRRRERRRYNYRRPSPFREALNHAALTFVALKIVDIFQR